MPFPLGLPAITALTGALSGYLTNRGQNQQNDRANEAADVQRQRLQFERAQQLRDNAMQDAQGAALNPVRANLYASLAQRLGLPAGTFAFNRGPSAVARRGPETATGAPERFSPQGEYESTLDPAIPQDAERLARADAMRRAQGLRYPYFGGG